MPTARFNIYDLFEDNISAEEKKSLLTKFEIRYDEHKHNITSILNGMEPSALQNLPVRLLFKPVSDDKYSKQKIKEQNLEKNIDDQIIAFVQKIEQHVALMEELKEEMLAKIERENKIEELEFLEQEEFEKSEKMKKEIESDLIHFKKIEAELDNLRKQMLERSMAIEQEYAKKQRKLTEDYLMLKSKYFNLMTELSQQAADKVKDMRGEDGQLLFEHLSKEELSERLKIAAMKYHKAKFESLTSSGNGKMLFSGANIYSDPLNQSFRDDIISSLVEGNPTNLSNKDKNDIFKRVQELATDNKATSVMKDIKDLHEKNLDTIEKVKKHEAEKDGQEIADAAFDFSNEDIGLDDFMGDFFGDIEEEISQGLSNEGAKPNKPS